MFEQQAKFNLANVGLEMQIVHACCKLQCAQINRFVPRASHCALHVAKQTRKHICKNDIPV